MATTNYTEWHPHVGTIWKRILELFTVWIADAALAWTAVAVGSGGFRGWTVTLTGAVDTAVYLLIDTTVLGTQVASPRFLRTLPGMDAQLKVMPVTQAGRTTKTEVNNKLVSIRRGIYTNWGAATLGSTTVATVTPPGPSASLDIRYFWVASNGVAFVDQITVYVATLGANESFYLDQQPYNAQQSEALTVAGGAAGGSVDLSGVVSALLEIADTETDYTANNGSNIFSLRSRVTVGP